jgi:hypothetical protein
MLVLLHWMHAVAPVMVGRVVWPAVHGEHVFGDTAWGMVENFPALQAVHRLVDPSLYFPAMHEVHAVAQLGQGVTPLASLASELHLTHADAPAVLPVPDGHAWQDVLPLKAVNVPAVHSTHEVPDAMLPGSHALHTVPVEYCSGDGHWAQDPVAGDVYWPARHICADASRWGVDRNKRVVVVVKKVTRFIVY